MADNKKNKDDQPTRTSIELTPEEKQALDHLKGTVGSKTRAGVIRRLISLAMSGQLVVKEHELGNLRAH